MRADHARIGTMLRATILAIGYAVDDIERGLWSDDEIRKLGDTLATAADAMRGEGPAIVPLVIDLSEGER
ncbi:hypothetical protein [Saccharopolyspora shandongensis]|uniref:hypothetical protein n=1 Tax=Saccharopolyspora shandongensis TaxID=418495 RepID=UPI0033EDBA83